MTRKIPSDAFEQYMALGPERSYRALADKYGVSKRAITKCAAREDWAERQRKIEREVRKRTDTAIAETIEETRDRHLKTLRAMHSRALMALKNYPLSTGMEAMRAAEMVIRLERLIIGEPSERSEVSVEAVTKRELERWAVRDGGD